MLIHHLFFQPDLTNAYCDMFNKVPLDRHTPRGLFEGSGGNCYLVCDDPYDRCAIALAHTELAPFTLFHLSDEPTDTGCYLGVGNIHLGQPCEPDSSLPPLGTLSACEEQVSLMVQDKAGRISWRTIARGRGNVPDRVYDAWSFMMDDYAVFFGVTNAEDSEVEPKAS